MYVYVSVEKMIVNPIFISVDGPDLQYLVYIYIWIFV